MPKTSEEMKREEEVRLLRKILEGLKAVRAILAKENPRSWETCIEEHIRRLDAEMPQEQPPLQNR